MAEPTNLQGIEVLKTATATEIKTSGWRGVMKKLAREGKGRLVITNNREAEAVILSPEEYGGMIEVLREVAARRAADLDALRRDFDARLEGLNQPDAADRLRQVLREPMVIGDVRAGESY